MKTRVDPTAALGGLSWRSRASDRRRFSHASSELHEPHGFMVAPGCSAEMKYLQRKRRHEVANNANIASDTAAMRD
jgi:hypothetical protein